MIPSRTVVSSQNFAGPNEPYGIEINYYLKNDISGEVTITVYDGTRQISELKGPNSAGLNCVLWNMRKDRERSEEEIARRRRQQESRAEEEPFFHVYDEVDYHRGSSEERFFSQPVGPGEYTVTLNVGDTVLKGKAIILQDYWYDK